MRLRLGRRGSALLLLGVVWLMMSHGFFVGRLGAAPGGIFQLVPGWVIGAGWVVTGLVALVYAFRRKHDSVAFAGLLVMPLIRAAAFLWAWFVYLGSNGAVGAGDGFIQAIVYGLIGALIYIIGGWPEPLRLPDAGDMAPAPGKDSTTDGH